MKCLFVDTAGWVSCADARDARHGASCAARDAWLEDGGILLTTDFVLDETLTVLRIRLGLDAAGRWWDQVDGSPRLRWEYIDATRLDKAREWFFRWRDKAFSFTDCTSFVVMRELSLKDALTTDHHFTQAGYRVLP